MHYHFQVVLTYHHCTNGALNEALLRAVFCAALLGDWHFLRNHVHFIRSHGILSMAGVP